LREDGGEFFTSASLDLSWWIAMLGGEGIYPKFILPKTQAMNKLRTFFVAVCICLPAIGFSQANLQFNQVLLLAAGGGTLTVPDGKVWKMTSGTAQGQSLNSARPFYITINGTQNHFVFRSQDGNGQPTTSSNTTFPFWLPAGATVDIPAVSAGGFRTVSVIEFNVIE